MFTKENMTKENRGNKGLNASIFVIFFCNRPRIMRGVHIFALECPKKKSKVLTARATSRVPTRMNMGSTLATVGNIKTRNNPVSISQITVFKEIKVVK